jgi:hypothetical protein
MAEESHIVETPQGVLMVNGIHAGSCMVVLIKKGENLSIYLSAEQSNEVARFMLFTLGQQRGDAERDAAAAVAAKAELEALATMRPPRAPRTAPSGPEPRALPAAPQRAERAGSGMVDYAEAARHFMAEGQDNYISHRLKSAGGARATGRTAYLADQLGLTIPQAKGRIVRARSMGLIPSTFMPVRGRQPRQRPELDNGQELETALG